MCSRADLQFHKHTLAVPEQVVKRLKKGVLSFREDEIRQPTIELSPPMTPEDVPLPPSAEEANDYLNAIDLYREAECESDYEDRMSRTEEVLEVFSKIANLHNKHSPKAEYFQALCQLELAENMIDPEEQLSGLESLLTLLQKIQNPLHPHFAQAKYLEGYCRCRLLVKTEPQLIIATLQKAVACFENVRNRTYVYFQDSQYWQGYCRYRLGKLERGQRDKMVNFDQARWNLLNVTDKNNLYYVQAQLLSLQCAFEISQVSHIPV